jgi:hypothetical protein
MEFWWEKNWDDVNWLPTLKKHSKFEIFENTKSIEYNFKISKVLYHMSMWCNVHDI